MSPHQFIPIYRWMTQLNLSGNHLVVYAIVWNYSQTRHSPVAASEIELWAKTGKTTTYRILRELEKRQLISITIKDGLRYCTSTPQPTAQCQNETPQCQNGTPQCQNGTTNRNIKIIKEEKEEKELFDSKDVSLSDNATPEEHEMTAEEKQEAALARDRFFERMGALTGNLKAGGREAKQQRQLRDEIQHAPTTPPPSPAAQAQRLLREAYDKGARAAESFDYDAFLPLARQIYARQPELLQECIRGYRDAKK